MIPPTSTDPHADLLEPHFEERLTPSPHIQDRLLAIYNEIKHPEPTLTTAQLLKFFSNSQGIPLTIEEEDDKKQWTFGEWLEIVWHNDGFKGQKLEDDTTEEYLSRPISNYFISSSHNTYLQGNQLASKSSTAAYRRVRIFYEDLVARPMVQALTLRRHSYAAVDVLKSTFGTESPGTRRLHP